MNPHHLDLVWISLPSYLHQDCHLVAMLMHVLQFVLNIKIVVFDEINHWHNYVTRKILQATLELYVLPLRHKIVLDKELELQLQVFYEVKRQCGLVNKCWFLLLLPFIGHNVLKRKLLPLHKMSKWSFLFNWTNGDIFNPTILTFT